jgi:hypothetical protein
VISLLGPELSSKPPRIKLNPDSTSLALDSRDQAVVPRGLDPTSGDEYARKGLEDQRLFASRAFDKWISHLFFCATQRGVSCAHWPLGVSLSV